MAQARVTEFYVTKKRNGDSQPSKRRKLQVTSDIPETIQNEPVATRSTRSSSRRKESVPPVSAEPENVLFTLSASDKGTKSASNRVLRQRTRKIKQIKGQKTIVEALESRSSSPTNSLDGEEVTSAWDEHDGPLTPSKKTKQNKEHGTEQAAKGSRKRDRHSVRNQSLATPLKEDQEENLKAPRSRKKLQLRANVIASSESENSENEVEIISTQEFPYFINALC